MANDDGMQARARLAGLLFLAVNASGQVGQIYFCGGSAIFFHLLQRSRIIPSAVAAFGLIATLVSLASGLVEIGSPDVARYLAFSGALLLLAELTAGVALIVAGARRALTVV